LCSDLHHGKYQGYTEGDWRRSSHGQEKAQEEETTITFKVFTPE
jgi:hypothetical protein